MNDEMWEALRFPCGKGTFVVVLIHPWKGRWARLFVEDIYGYSPDVYGGLGVAEAKLYASALRRVIKKDHLNSHVDPQVARGLIGEDLWRRGLAKYYEADWEEWGLVDRKEEERQLEEELAADEAYASFIVDSSAVEEMSRAVGERAGEAARKTFRQEIQRDLSEIEGALRALLPSVPGLVGSGISPREVLIALLGREPSPGDIEEVAGRLPSFGDYRLQGFSARAAEFLHQVAADLRAEARSRPVAEYTGVIDASNRPAYPDNYYGQGYVQYPSGTWYYVRGMPAKPDWRGGTPGGIDWQEAVEIPEWGRKGESAYTAEKIAKSLRIKVGIALGLRA